MPYVTEIINLLRVRIYEIAYLGTGNVRMLWSGLWRPHPTGQERPVGSRLQFPGLFAVFFRNRSLNLPSQVFSPDRLQCSVTGR